jgi:hypothetical protein
MLVAYGVGVGVPFIIFIIVISFIVLVDGFLVHPVGSIVEYTLTKLVNVEDEIFGLYDTGNAVKEFVTELESIKMSLVVIALFESPSAPYKLTGVAFIVIAPCLNVGKDVIVRGDVKVYIPETRSGIAFDDKLVSTLGDKIPTFPTYLRILLLL